MRKMLIILFAGMLFWGCKKNDSSNPTDPIDINDEKGFGLNFISDEEMEKIPMLDTGTLFNGRLTALPSVFDLNMPPIKNQGGEGSCAAFAGGYASRSYLFYRDNNSSYLNNNILNEKVIFSPEFIYNIGKTPNESCPKAGMTFYGLLELIKNTGVCSWASMPYSDQNGCNTLPTASQYAEAANYKIKSYYRLASIDPDYIKQIIYNKNPVLIGALVTPEFMQDGKSVWSTFTRSLGGHAMVICGWNDQLRAYKLMNSWGTGWGNKGYGWISYDLIGKVTSMSSRPGLYELYVMQTSGTVTDFATITTSAPTSVTLNSAVSGGKIINNGGTNITARGVVWSTDPNPTIALSKKTNNGTGIGTFTSNLTGLSPNTTYYVRAYATNSAGTAYGNQLSFTTSQTSINPATLTTLSVNNITANSATSGGSITNDGGSPVTQRGICWSTSPNPTTANNTAVAGSGTGSFTANLTGLTSNTIYYVRAYAINTAGTAYGDTKSFTTSSSPGTITGLNCTGAINSGSLSQGASASGVISSVPYTGGNGGAYAAFTVQSTGVAGLTASIAAGTFASGNGNLTITITGTPSTSGTASFALNIGGKSCTLTRTVNTTGNIGITAHTCGAQNVHNGSLTYGTMTDQDGNTYKTIQIGAQVWMAENLKTTKYRNATPIFNAIDDIQWRNNTNGAYCIYKNISTNDCPYGKLYNWYAVTNANQLCPTGWHVPTDEEWTILTNFLGGGSTAGNKMKSTGTQYWVSPNTEAGNTRGFSGLPGGGRGPDGATGFIGAFGMWWSSTENLTTKAWTRQLNYNSVSLDRNFTDKASGNSVRCIKD